MRTCTGPVIIDWLTEHGFETYPRLVVPDGEAVGAALRALLTQAPAVIITSGGTGLSPTDATPEQTLPLLDREIPGIMEGIRGAGTPKPAWRCSAGATPAPPARRSSSISPAPRRASWTASACWTPSSDTSATSWKAAMATEPGPLKW